MSIVLVIDDEIAADTREAPAFLMMKTSFVKRIEGLQGSEVVFLGSMNELKLWVSKNKDKLGSLELVLLDDNFNGLSEISDEELFGMGEAEPYDLNDGFDEGLDGPPEEYMWGDEPQGKDIYEYLTDEIGVPKDKFIGISNDPVTQAIYMDNQPQALFLPDDLNIAYKELQRIKNEDSEKSERKLK